jgi:hypothetical protein
LREIGLFEKRSTATVDGDWALDYILTPPPVKKARDSAL